MTTLLKSVVSRKAYELQLIGFSHYSKHWSGMQDFLDGEQRISYIDAFYFYHKDSLCLK